MKFTLGNKLEREHLCYLLHSDTQAFQRLLYNKASQNVAARNVDDPVALTKFAIVLLRRTTKLVPENDVNLIYDILRELNDHVDDWIGNQLNAVYPDIVAEAKAEAKAKAKGGEA